MKRKIKDPFLKPNKLAIRQIIGGLIVAVALGLAFYGRGRKEPELRVINGQAFSTSYVVKVVSRKFPENAVKRIKESVDAQIEFVDREMSRYRRDSSIARFNAQKNTDPFFVSRETATLLSRARQVSEMTQGAFDVTVGPLIALWGFYTKSKDRAKAPSAAEIEAAKAEVGFEDLEIDMSGPSIRKKHPSLHVDLSAMAKGFAVDRIAEALDKFGVTNYMVEVGGEVRAKGVNVEQRAWRIGIEKPLKGSRELFQVVELADKSVATSGDYRNYYELDGKSVSHTVDPRDGIPLSHQLASVTVVHDECALADALATAFTVLGPKDGYKLAEARGIPALFIVRGDDGILSARATSDFERFSVSLVNREKEQKPK